MLITCLLYDVMKYVPAPPLLGLLLRGMFFIRIHKKKHCMEVNARYVTLVAGLNQLDNAKTVNRVNSYNPFLIC